MKVIQYRALYADGHHEFVTVTAKNVASGFAQAARRAVGDARRVSDSAVDDHLRIHSVEFWMVLS